MNGIVIVLVRGLPGAGKSTLAAKIAGPLQAALISADDYRVDESGAYRWAPEDQTGARLKCYSDVEHALSTGHNVVVHNTFTTHEEVNRYKELAVMHRAALVEVPLFDAGLTDNELAKRNVHDVPEWQIRRMRMIWQD